MPCSGCSALHGVNPHQPPSPPPIPPKKTCRGMMYDFDGLFIWYCSSKTSFLLVWYKALGICSETIWESERRPKPLKPPFCLGRPMWYHFYGIFFAELFFAYRALNRCPNGDITTYIWILNCLIPNIPYSKVSDQSQILFLILSKFKQN